MKKNNKGFLLVETLVVSTFCLTVLVILFLQFKNLIINYNTSFKHNTVEGIYNLGAIKNHLQNNNITLNDPTYIYDGTTYNSSCNAFCKSLIEAENIKIIIYTNSNLDNFKNNSLNSLSNEGLKKFVSGLKNNEKGNRLIAEFNDGTYASITY